MFTFASFRPYGSLSRCLRGNMGGPSWMGFRSDMILIHPFFNFSTCNISKPKMGWTFSWKWITGLQFSFEASIDPLWDASCTLLSRKVLENIVTVSWSRIAKMNFQPKVQLAMPGCLVWLEFLRWESQIDVIWSQFAELVYRAHYVGLVLIDSK